MDEPLETTRALSLEADFRSATSLIAQESKDGIDLLRRLSANGYTPASYELGNCLYIGNLIDKNESRAIMKWREAGNAGHVLSKINVIKHEWLFAGRLEKIQLGCISIALMMWAFWLISRSDGHDTRIMGNMDPRLKI